MKHILLSIICFSAVLFNACTDFDEINRNPNATEVVTPAMLATNLILKVAKPENSKPFIYHNLASKQLAWGEGAEGYQYNDFGRTTFSPYLSVVNVRKMIDGTTDANREAYTGLGLFVKAHLLFYLSIETGDIPYRDAMSGEQGNLTPVYDTQKDVMLQVLDDLEKSDLAFSKATGFDGDPIHNGNVDTWRRIVNSFRLKVLMYLSKKENDPDLKVKERFDQIMKNCPLLQNNGQNLQIIYSNKANQIYPMNRVNTNHYPYGIVSSVLVDSLKARNDYRLFYYAEPSAYAIETEKKSVADWDAYPGIDPSMPHDDLKILYNAKKYCGFNTRYYLYESGEPVMKVGYIEQNFIIAEAIVRGWTTGNAESYYNEGIKSALKFTATNTPVAYCHDREITEDYISDYMKGTRIVFAGNTDQQLKQIWIQKYILYFMQHQWDSFYEYRRTGYPVLPVNPSTNRNEVKDKIPVRWMYPQKEYNMNIDHLGEALNRQYSGQDKVNDPMWILK